MIAAFDTNAQSGPQKDFMDKYSRKYGKSEFTLFAAYAYDAVYALSDALKFAIENKKDVNANMSPSALCEVLKYSFQNEDFEFRGISGNCENGEKAKITWNADGTVNKKAVKHVFKAHD